MPSSEEFSEFWLGPRSLYMRDALRQTPAHLESPVRRIPENSAGIHPGIHTLPLPIEFFSPNTNPLSLDKA